MNTLVDTHVATPTHVRQESLRRGSRFSLPGTLENFCAKDRFSQEEGSAKQVRFSARQKFADWFLGGRNGLIEEPFPSQDIIPHDLLESSSNFQIISTCGDIEKIVMKLANVCQLLTAQPLGPESGPGHLLVKEGVWNVFLVLQPVVYDGIGVYSYLDYDGRLVEKRLHVHFPLCEFGGKCYMARSVSVTWSRREGWILDSNYLEAPRHRWCKGNRVFIRNPEAV